MAHGSGGRMTHELIANWFVRQLDNPSLRACNDAAVVVLGGGGRLAVSTDSHVVWPLFFSGGDIGRLAVCGTVNDLAMMGAVPRFLTAGFILEEGLGLEIVERVVASMRAAADEAGIEVIAGDTKVVQRGKADGLYINTAGVGEVPHGIELGGARAQPGDVVLLSGPVGDHGIAVLSARGELGLEVEVASDIAPLNHLVAAMLRASHDIHVLRDPTRGGVATTLNEIARQSGVGIVIDEERVPVRPAVAAACELLGFDPLYIANEGKLVAIVGREDGGRVLETMRGQRLGAEAVMIGEVRAEPQGRVLLRTAIGSHRMLETLSGEMLPRIC
ncbi:MAG: hydrogenase expression/formation protein HypE [Chloroflexota bacterium]